MKWFKNKLHIAAIIFACFTLVLLSMQTLDEDDFPERAKIVLREVGHQLLLANQDSTSLVLPIKMGSSNRFQIQFESDLTVHPDTLVSIVDAAFKQSDLPNSYRVEVLNCTDREVAYSYAQREEAHNSIIPCSGRQLPRACYTISLKFTDLKNTLKNETLLYASIGSAILLLFFGFRTKKAGQAIEEKDSAFRVIGSFRFYTKENKLVREVLEIQLSKKEGELLEILSEHINKVVKREELEKRVWEDNGVIVGRSLDTYMSKLRKKFKDDPLIKLSNIHGVGYKLEVSL